VRSGDADALKRAVDLCTAALLADWSEEWVSAERVRRELAYMDTLETLARLSSADGRLDECVQWLRKAVSIDQS